ncbi:RNA-directed DNA polymerase from mobile element jockey [Nephila pilipes]|uniref:RNA-directed DNA polymerase from mobile element jockey n=1 Tax=Nephila pilipes TaxID=299642 RepID=A0A8X6PC18_NEPPI|nr:RNA-directed DNA polymerase from mobile element jockey [Nephila pilipes]
MKTSAGEHKYCFRNPDHSSVFSSELVAVRKALNLALEADTNDGGTACLQWIPSHVGVYGNEIADLLAVESSELPTAPSTKLQTSEVHSLFLAKINTTWRTSPEHAWYAAESSRLSLQCSYPRLAQTTLSTLRTGHIKSVIFNGNEKTCAVCRCSAIAAPSHILDCIGASVEQLLNKGDVDFDLIVRHGLLDLV